MFMIGALCAAVRRLGRSISTMNSERLVWVDLEVRIVYRE